MASGMPDLGKQIGPLPLGAWIIVVGAGVGIALYTRRSSPAPDIVESGNGIPGVGVGGSGQFTELVPGAGGAGGATAQKPTTNEQWGVAAINWLISMNYPTMAADSAIRKYLAGSKMSAQEYTLIGQVLALSGLGAPPQVLPPTENETEPPTPTPVEPQAVYENVTEGSHVDPWLSVMRSRYGVSEADIILKNITLWGPQLITASKAGIGYVPVGTPGSVRTFGSNQRIRIK
jgi:hypothetical protein